MSVTALRMVCGLMPCSTLYACCSSRRRLVSQMARCIESVTLSAYMITWPSTLRAARPMVWMSDVSRAQEALLVGVEDGHQRHLGQVEALPQQVDADQHVELAEAEVAEDLDALDGVDLGVQVADPHAQLEQVVGEVLGHLLGERGDQDAVALVDPLVDLLDAGRRSGPWWACTMISGSTRPVGRTICSTTWPECSSS